MIKTVFCLPRSVRVKLNTRCQFKCKFCHQEGSMSAKDINKEEFIEALRVLRKDLMFYRIHFTGGEPTLYNEFESLLKKTKKLGFSNALTTNGQLDANNLIKLKKAGLDSINFSLHALDPYAFLNIQNVSLGMKDGVNWAKNCIEKTIENVLSANKILDTKINCVVGYNTVGPREVLGFCIKNNIKLRFLNDLTAGETALNNIKEILYKENAEIVGHEITFISSSHRLDYKINNYNFGVKCIRQFFLKTLCDNCNFKKGGRCLEGFYGIRLEDNPLRVRLCLNRSGKPFVQTLSSFLKSPQLKEIKKETSDVIKYLRRDSLIEEQRKII